MYILLYVFHYEIFEYCASNSTCKTRPVNKNQPVTTYIKSLTQNTPTVDDEEQDSTSLTERVLRGHWRPIDSVESGSIVALLVLIREVTTWSRIWDQMLSWGPVEAVLKMSNVCSNWLISNMCRVCPSIHPHEPQFFSTMYARHEKWCGHEQ